MKINNTSDLRTAIRQLERQEKINKELLIEQFHETLDSLKPLNLLKSSLGKVFKSPDTVDNVLKAGVGLGTGLLSKTLVGKSTGFVKRLLLTGLELGAAGVVAKNAKPIKLAVLNMLGKIFKPKKNSIDR